MSAARLTLILALAAAAPASGQRGFRLDPILEREHGPLIDSLVALVGAAPVEVRSGVSTLREGAMVRTNRGMVLVVSSGSRHAVLHECGHFLNAVRPLLFYEYADSLFPRWALTERGQHEAEEAFAEDFAAAFTGWENGWISYRPGAAWLQRRLWPTPTARASGQ